LGIICVSVSLYLRADIWVSPDFVGIKDYVSESINVLRNLLADIYVSWLILIFLSSEACVSFSKDYFILKGWDSPSNFLTYGLLPHSIIFCNVVDPGRTSSWFTFDVTDRGLYFLIIICFLTGWLSGIFGGVLGGDYVWNLLSWTVVA